MTVEVKPAIVTETLEPQKSGCCGAYVFLTAEQWREIKRNGVTFYCPYGHPRWFGESQATKEQRRREAAERHLHESRARIDDLLREVSTQKKALQRTRRRAENGTCPHCHRTFKQVNRHIRAKHPEADVRTRSATGL